MKHHKTEGYKSPSPGKIRTTLEVVQHLPHLYRIVAENLVERGEIEIVAKMPQPKAGAIS
jgi:hypothetical protein